MFFSLAPKYSICDLCTSCGLTSGGRAAAYTSWARTAAIWHREQSCELPQRASSCKCSDLNLRVMPAVMKLPSCIPTPQCQWSSGSSATSASAHRLDATQHEAPTAAGAAASSDSATTSIVLVYGFHRDRVRPWYKADPIRSYLNSMRLMFRLVLSLRRVGTTLPIHLMPMGELDPLGQGFRSWLTAHGVTILPPASGPRFDFRVPPWSSPHQRGSFAHMMVLGLTQFSKLVVLDLDTVVLRNREPSAETTHGAGGL